ncbi:MAG: hypothetical protein EXR69_07980 [Myxococcales bacterium]|nr:hypothetical protein [Myxococcales bacterium]
MVEAELPDVPTGVVDLAVAIELECAALYEAYGRSFAKRAELATFWKLYAEAERYHAATIRIHQASFADAPVSGQVDPTGAQTFLSELRAARVVADRGGCTVKEAMATARWVEEAAAELHGRTQFFQSHPYLAELFTKMAEEDAAHRDLLTTAEAKFG